QAERRRRARIRVRQVLSRTHAILLSRAGTTSREACSVRMLAPASSISMARRVGSSDRRSQMDSRYLRAGALAVLLLAGSAGPSLAQTAQETPATPDAAEGGDGADYGWVGLIGLIGLAGLLGRRDRADRTTATGHR